MIDAMLDPDLLALRDTMEAFARDELDDGGGAAREAAGQLNRDGWLRCAEKGLFRLGAPARYGGRDGDLLALTVALEALGYACPGVSLIYAATAHIAGAVLTLAQFGSHEQLDRFFVPLLDGRAIGAQAITEPGAGSDVSRLATTARLDGYEYVLDGEKLYCTNAPIADIIVTYCTVDPGRGVFGQSAFIVPAATPGLRVTVMPKMGLSGCPLGRVTFDGCHVPASLRLGADGQGAVVFKRSILAERVLMMAGIVGAMRRQLEACVERARTRRQFGQAIGRFQYVAGRVTDMKLRYETSRLLLYKAAHHRQASRELELDAAMAKLHISESYLASSLDAVQVFGGEGYTTAAEVNQALLQAVGGRIYAGTSEVQRLIIGKLMGI